MIPSLQVLQGSLVLFLSFLCLLPGPRARGPAGSGGILKNLRSCRSSLGSGVKEICLNVVVTVFTDGCAIALIIPGF